MVANFAVNPFKPATKEQSKLRMALIGPSGSGKTWTALSIASELGKVALIDTERGSASKYAGDFQFDVMELTDYSPLRYIEAIKAAAAFGYDVVVIDSLSHAWNAPGGVLDMVDKAAKRSQSNNSFAAWRDVTPVHNQLIDALVGTNIHLIATMRSKTEYVLETNERGKTMPRKVGLAPVQRDGMEYEFDIFAEMDVENTLMISKTRCSALNGAVIAKPGKNVAEVIKAWLTDGAIPELKVVKRWSEAEALAWVKQQKEAGWTEDGLRIALVVNRWGEWDGSAEDASAALAIFDANDGKKDYTDVKANFLAVLEEAGISISEIGNTNMLPDGTFEIIPNSAGNLNTWADMVRASKELSVVRNGGKSLVVKWSEG